MISNPLRLFLPLVLLSAAANASTTFNFDGDSPGTSTLFTDSVNGISATFSSLADPGGFTIYGSMFETLTGNVALNIAFTVDLSAITLDFATSDFITPSPFTITAFEGSTQVGTATSTGQFLPGFIFPEGEITFEGGPFNSIVLSSTAMDFAVDNITVIAAPEPGTLALLGAGLLLAGLPSMRRKAARR
jgi:PEP-CTERM motif